MELILVRHGAAEKGEDPNGEEQALTKQGSKKISDLAAGIKTLLGKRIHLHIWSSPLVRAWQTSQILADMLGVKQVEKLTAIQEGDLSSLIEMWTKLNKDDCLIIVGHQPHLQEWSVLLAGAALPFKKGAAASFKIKSDAPDAAELCWFTQPAFWSK